MVVINIHKIEHLPDSRLMDNKNKATKIEAVQPHQLSNDTSLNTLLNSVVDEVSLYAERLGGQIKKLSDIGRALSGVHDLNTLLEMIVDQARNFTYADAGTLYIIDTYRVIAIFSSRTDNISRTEFYYITLHA